MKFIDSTIRELGDGTIDYLENGDRIFKLHSYSKNPIIRPQNLNSFWYEDGKLRIGAIFNGGATLFNNKIILVPRSQKEYQRGRFFDESMNVVKFEFKNYISKIWILISEDGINFHRYKKGVIRGDGRTHNDFLYGIEDMRIIKTKQRYWLIGCGKVIPPFQGFSDNRGDRMAIYSTLNFEEIQYHGIIKDLDIRNTVFFPEAVSGKYYIFLRFDNSIHLDILEAGMDQLHSPTKYDKLWRKIYDRREQSKLLETKKYLHEKEKIGPGPPPIKTSKGWLVIYHAVGEIGNLLIQSYGISDKIPRCYTICAVVLDLHDPSKILCRTKYPLYIPSYPWELYGNLEYPIDIPVVTFPTGIIVKNNKILLYCGSGDKYIVLLSARLDYLLDYLWKECRLTD
ncbi:MAG: Beta-1,4-mannooligosaccharide phosphorylase [Candidatus Heimdallarchaeota archaeon LC_3]|nr:MAG: Beta-1,4-mannooligosaccharide phosphorylase [Candidatus Heimdallarchaeota archaeon LC_3]